MKVNKILLDHGGGGAMGHELTKNLFLPAYGNSVLDLLEDGARLKLDDREIVFSTDTFVVDPIFFPGGSIGHLAINGTVNDISMCGGKPQFLSLSFVIEEGFSMKELELVIDDVSSAAGVANVKIVTGDTKVVPRKAVDKIFINTSGIGSIRENADLSCKFAKPGDSVILSGTMADHGMAIMTQRQGFKFDSSIISDTVPLNGMVSKMLKTGRVVHALRDPTRGGVGTTLNEIARKSKVGIRIFEKDLPIKDEVASVCNILGFDPIYVANEGKLIAFVPASDATEILSAIRRDRYGRDACIIGEVVDDHPGQVFMTTLIGGERILDMLTGEQLPRIC